MSNVVPESVGTSILGVIGAMEGFDLMIEGSPPGNDTNVLRMVAGHQAIQLDTVGDVFRYTKTGLLGQASSSVAAFTATLSGLKIFFQ